MEPTPEATHPAADTGSSLPLRTYQDHGRDRGRHIRRSRLQQAYQARQRHRIPKSSLVISLFKTLDVRNSGLWGRDELTNFALLTGHQGELDDIFVEVSHMLRRIRLGGLSLRRQSTQRSGLLIHRRAHGRSSPNQGGTQKDHTVRRGTREAGTARALRTRQLAAALTT